MLLHKSGFQLGDVEFEEDGSWKADIKETDNYWEGFPYLENGYVEAKTVRLEKTIRRIFYALVLFNTFRYSYVGR